MSLLDENKIRIARKPGKKHKEIPLGCTEEGKRWKENIREGSREGRTRTSLELSLENISVFINLFKSSTQVAILTDNECMYGLDIHADVGTHRNHFEILFNQTKIRFLFTIFWLIWNQTDVRLVPNQPENGKYNLISGWFNKISKWFLCVRDSSARSI